jgi:hypothetical protein
MLRPSSRPLPVLCAVAFLLLLCAGCTSAPPEGRQVVSASLWTEPIIITQAQQADAPALVLSGEQLIAAWVGMDARGVHQDAARVDMNGQTVHPSVTLPLPPTHPYAQQMFPGAGGSVHLLWLDAGDDATNLYAALLSPDLSVLRGPVSLSDGLALAYSAVPDGDGGLWAAWVGGLLSEMSLYVRRIDAEGRPLLDTTTIASAASDPALLRTTDGQIWLFWTADGRLMRQRLDPADSPAGEAQALTGAVSLALGDRLMNVCAGLDASSAYFFWNITRADGTNETWWTAGALDAALWRQPERLRSTLGADPQTRGAGLATAQAATGEDFALRWVAPALKQSNILSAAVESDAGLGILTLRDGEVVGFGIAVPGVRLIGMPALAVNPAGKLHLAWSAPGDDSADLLWTTTR